MWQAGDHECGGLGMGSADQRVPISSQALFEDSQPLFGDSQPMFVEDSQATVAFDPELEPNQPIEPELGEKKKRATPPGSATKKSPETKTARVEETLKEDTGGTDDQEEKRQLKVALDKIFALEAQLGAMKTAANAVSPTLRSPHDVVKTPVGNLKPGPVTPTPKKVCATPSQPTSTTEAAEGEEWDEDENSSDMVALPGGSGPAFCLHRKSILNWICLHIALIWFKSINPSRSQSAIVVYIIPYVSTRLFVIRSGGSGHITWCSENEVEEIVWDQTQEQEVSRWCCHTWAVEEWRRRPWMAWDCHGRGNRETRRHCQEGSQEVASRLIAIPRL